MNNSTKQDNSAKDASLSRKRGFVTVPASPFNAVKLDLAIILILSVLVWLLVTYLLEGFLIQILCLAGFGVLSMMWIIIRTRRVLKAIEVASAKAGHET